MIRLFLFILISIPGLAFSQTRSPIDASAIKHEAKKVIFEFEGTLNSIISSDMSENEIDVLVSELTDFESGYLDVAISFDDDSKPIAVQSSFRQVGLSEYLNNLNSEIQAKRTTAIKFSNKQLGEIKEDRGRYYVNVYFKTVFDVYFKEDRSIAYEPILKYAEIELEENNGEYHVLILGIYEAEDQDNDWVANELDKCPWSDPGVAVSLSGCASDKVSDKAIAQVDEVEPDMAEEVRTADNVRERKKRSNSTSVNSSNEVEKSSYNNLGRPVSKPPNTNNSKSRKAASHWFTQGESF